MYSSSTLVFNKIRKTIFGSNLLSKFDRSVAKIQIELLTTGLVLTGHALGIRINKFVIGDRSQNYVYKRRGVGGQKN